jgi:hypothetical protein
MFRAGSTAHAAHGRESGIPNAEASGLATECAPGLTIGIRGATSVRALRRIQPTDPSMRPLMLLVCLALAGCVTDGGPGDAVSGSAQAAASKPAEPKPAEPDASKKDAAKKKDDKKDDKNDEWWKQGGITHEKVSAMCWMKYEQGRKDQSLDKRADLVNKCVADTLKANPPPSAGSSGVIR